MGLRGVHGGGPGGPVQCWTLCRGGPRACAGGSGALVAVVCAGCPVFASWKLSTAVETLRETTIPTDARAIVSLRKSLDELPETDHPLGY